MIYLTDNDIQMLNDSITIMKNVYNVLRDMPIENATKNVNSMDSKMRQMYQRKDGKDTMLADVMAERTISVGLECFGHFSAFVRAYNEAGVIVTEERGKIGDGIGPATPVIITDPVDRSSYLEKIVRKHSSDCKTIGQVFDREAEMLGNDARVESVNSSVTLLYDNMIKYSIVLNHFTAEMFVGYEKGVFVSDVDDIETEDQLVEGVRFKDKESLDMVCYTKDGKYEDNRFGTHLRFFPRYEKRKSPGGPNRFANLLADEQGPVGVIAHNGEKIQESLPNIAMAFFSCDNLKAYKMFCDRKHTNHRAGRGLTPNLENSIYSNGLLINTGLKLGFLNEREYPSQFRDTTLITPTANEPAVTMMEGMVQRNYAIQII